MKNLFIRRIKMIFILLFLAGNIVSYAASKTDSYLSPVSFMENKGQWPDEVLFQGRSVQTNVYLLQTGLSFSQRGEETEGSEDRPALVWNMKFINCIKGFKVIGDSGSKSVWSFLSGNDQSKWVIHPMEYKTVLYSGIYRNIDLRFYGSGKELEYDYILHPGSRISDIHACYEGIKALRINSAGDLEVQTLWDIQVQKAPKAWQVKNGVKQFVPVQYHLLNDSSFAFIVPGGYDHSTDLVIDPLFQMVWCSYTNATGGSNNINYCFSNAMDKDGNVYLTGMVDATFPITPGAYSGPGNVSPEIFVAKFSSDGSQMLYGTYLPGNSSEHGIAIQVDDYGRAYITGVVDLNITGITNYPSTSNAYQTVHNTGSDAILTVLNPGGTGLVYSSFLGGTGSDAGYALALGDPGIAYVTGRTSVGNFPVKASTPFPTGDQDVFISKFDINQSGSNSLIYSARIGAGSFSTCGGRGIAVNSAGNAFITGTISSSFGTPNFPLSPGSYNHVYNTGQDGSMCFVLKLTNTLPVTLDYSTFLSPGGSNAIAIHPSTGDAFIAGSTNSFIFPVTPGALQTVHAGANGTDAFVIRLNAAGDALVYSTFLGGPTSDAGTGIAVNSISEAYVSGISQSGFPTSAGAFQENNAGTYDFFAAHINSSGSAYSCGGATYIGGTSADYSGSFYDYPSPHVSIRDHGSNRDTICISSTTHSTDFPTTAGSYGPVKLNGIADQPVFFKLSCQPAINLPSSSFSSSDSVFCNKKAIDFFDHSLNNPTSWTWYFPGAIPSTSNLQNPTGIFYPAGGSFDVSLVTCNASGCDSVHFSAFITEYNPPAAPLITLRGDTLCTGTYSAYEWYEASAPTVVLGTGPCFLPPVPGNYSVQVTDTNGCKASSRLDLTDITGSEIRHHEIHIGMNPFHDKTWLEVTGHPASSVELSVLDIAGREIEIRKKIISTPASSRIELDFTGMNDALYLCRIRTDNSMRTVRLLKLGSR